MRKDLFESDKKATDAWISFYNEMTAEGVDDNEAFQKLNGYITPLPERLKITYRHDFHTLQGNIDRRINRLTKDVFSAVHLSVQESFRGNDGVLLLSHTRGGASTASAWVETSVIKWTNPLETASCEFLKLFLNGIYVPKASIFDFDRKCMIREDRSLSMSNDFSDVIQRNLNSIRAEYSHKEMGKANIMISERVSGANLTDFIVNNYWETLSESQKGAIFQGIGQMALVDLVMGNRDRFLAFDMNFRGFDEYFEANIGNLMIQMSDKELASPHLHAIDNEVQIENIVDGEDYDGYNRGFQELLSNPDWTTTTSTAIIEALATSYKTSSTYFEEVPKNNGELKVKLDHFVSILRKDESRELIEAGLLEMHASLSLKFQSEEFLLSLDSIRDKYAAEGEVDQPSINLYYAIKHRINLFLNP